PDYSGSKTYEYDYEGILLAGLPEKGLARAGLKIVSKVQISGVAQKTYFLKLVSPQIKEYNGIWPKDQFSPMESVTQTLANQLQFPIKFEYNSGRVGQIFAPTEITETVLNIQKGILNMLQLNIKKTQNVYELQEIVETLHHLVQNNQQQVHEDAPFKFFKLTHLLRIASLQNIEAIWKQFENRHNYRRWILDAIPAVGNLHAFRFLKDKIQNKHITSAEAFQTLMIAMHLLRPDSENMRIAAELVQTHRVQQEPHLHKIAMLGYGSLVYKYCEKHSRCPENILEPLHNFATEAASRAHQEEIVLALKAIGNAGQPSSIKRIMKFLPGFSSGASHLTVKVQVDAVMALRNIAKQDRRKVQEVTLQIFMDRALNPEVRMIACVVLFETKPSMALVTTLADALLKETSLQVASFTYSHMKALTKSTSPDYAPVAAACNLAVKMLSPKLDRMSYRYSKALHLDTFQTQLMAGAAASLYIINDAASIVPRALVSKIRGYFSGVAADLLEFGVRAEGLDEVLLRKHVSVQGSSTMNKIQRILKAFSDWKSLPSNKPLVSAYMKLFGQEICFNALQKSGIEYAMQLASEPIDRHEILKRIVKMLQDGAAIQLSKSLLASEVRRIVPTCVGLPMELGLHSAAVVNAAVNVRTEMSPPATDNFRITQLMNSNVQVQAEVISSLSLHTIAVMGINTHWIQAGVEVYSKGHIKLPLTFTARIDMKEKNFKVDSLPCQQEEKLLSLSAQAFAVTRTVQGNYEKKTPIVPDSEQLKILKEHFASQAQHSSQHQQDLTKNFPEYMSSEFSYLSSQHTKKSKKKHHICIKTRKFGIQLCFLARTQNAAFLKQSPLYQAIGDHLAEFTLKPDHTDEPIERLQIEVQTGPKAASKLIKMISLKVTGKDEEVTPQGKTVLLKLKKILHTQVKKRTNETSSLSSSSAYSNTNRNSSSSSSSSRYSKLRENLRTGHHSSQSSSSSSSSSSSWRKRHRTQSQNRDKNNPRYRQRSSSSRRSSSSSSSSSSRRSSHANRSQRFHKVGRSGNICLFLLFLQEQGCPEIYAYKFQSHRIFFGSIFFLHDNYKVIVTYIKISEWVFGFLNVSAFLGDSMPPILAIILRAIRSDRQQQGYQVALYHDPSSAKSRVQVMTADLTENSKWQICVDAVQYRPYNIKVAMKWGQECQDHKVSFKEKTGHLANHPAVQLKIKWRRIPRQAQEYAEMVAEYIPGAALLLGFSEETKRNPSRQVSLILASTSPRTIDVVIKTPQMTLYTQGVSVPVTLPIGQNTLLESQQSVINYIPYILAESLSGQCVMEQNSITTFNKVRFQTELPDSCEIVLAQDCTPALRWIVILKQKESENYRSLFVSLDDNITLNDMSNHSSTFMTKMVVTFMVLEWSFYLNFMNLETKLLHYTSHKDFSNELFWFDVLSQIWVDGTMKGKTCGVCGQGDGESRREYQMPGGCVAKSAESFTQSWVITGDTCQDDCKLKREFVKLDKQTALHGKDVKCYSTDPVLQCMSGCTPTNTTPVRLGFHCLPIDTVVNLLDGNFSQKNEDLEETMDSHIACSCTSQCS
ncbi:VIT protein, partial [Atractosteus spatula]|nr:VIT protein [Atractosteus spatula]